MNLFDWTGKTITRVEGDYGIFSCKTTVPGKESLLNFDLEVSAGKILVLDNYGNETFPEEFQTGVSFLGPGPYTIGIIRESGQICAVHFSQEKKALVATVTRMEEWVVPGKFLPKLDQLMSCKRPFYLGMTERSLFDLATKWIGHKDIEGSLVVDLDFHPRRLQIWGQNWREVGGWNS